MRRLVKKITVMLLTVTILVTSVPMGTFAAEREATETVQETVSETDNQTTQSSETTEDDLGDITTTEPSAEEPTTSQQPTEETTSSVEPTDESHEVTEGTAAENIKSPVISCQNVEDITSNALVRNLNYYGAGSTDTPLFTGFTGTTASMPTMGEVNVLVITVDFADKKFDDSYINNVENLFFGEENKDSEFYPYESLAAYYKRSSYDKLHINGEIYNYHSTRNRSEYEYGDPYDLYEEVITDYANNVRSQCDGSEEEKQAYLNFYLSKYDANQDGTFDGLYVNFAGETTEWATYWWSRVDYYNGYSIGNYSFGSICTLDTVTYPGAKTVIHETGHMLGLADYYDYSTGLRSEVLSATDPMNNNSLDHNGFSKMLLGWIDPEDVTILTGNDYRELSLEPFATSGKLVLIVPEYNDQDGLYTEFFMLQSYEPIENDYNGGMTSCKGLKVYHIYAYLDDSGYFVANNTSVNTNTFPLIRLLDKDGTEIHGIKFNNSEFPDGIYSSMINDSCECFYKEGDELTPYTIPASYLYSQPAVYAQWITGINANIVVDNITIQNGTATFNAGFADDRAKPEITYIPTNNSENFFSSELNYTVSFNQEIRAYGSDWIKSGNILYNDTGELYDETGNLIGKIRIKIENLAVLNKLELQMQSLTTLSVGNYKIHIPGGILSNAYGELIEEDIDFIYENGTDLADKILPDETVKVIKKSNGFNAWNGQISEDGSGCILVDDSMELLGSKYDWYCYPISEFMIQEKIKINIDSTFQYLNQIEKLNSGDYLALFTGYGSNSNTAGIYTFDSNGNIKTERIINLSKAGMSIGILDKMVTIFDGTILTKYDYSDAAKDTSTQVQCKEHITVGGGNRDPQIYRVDDNHYAIDCNGYGYLFDDDNICRIFSEKDEFQYRSFSSINGFFYVSASKFINKEYSYFVLKYDSSYNLIAIYPVKSIISKVIPYEDMLLGIYHSAPRLSWGSTMNYCYNKGINDLFYFSADMRNYTFKDNSIYAIGEDADQKNIIFSRTDLSKLEGTHPYEQPQVVLPEGFSSDEHHVITVKNGTRKDSFAAGFDKDKYTVSFAPYLYREENSIHTAYGDYIEDGLLAYVSVNDTNYTECYLFNLLPQYTVSFKSNGGTGVQFQEVSTGDCAVSPTAPTKDGYNFVGWYLDDKLFDFSTPITADITLTAKWKEYDTVPTPVANVASGSKVNKDSDIELSCSLEGASIYYTIDVGYLDVLATLYKEPIKISNYTIIHAKAVKEGYKDSEIATFTYTIKENYTVIFDSKGGSTVEPQTVKEEDSAIEPKAPTKTGYNFAGWYLDDKLFDFSTPITADITLTAKWVEYGTTPPPTANVTSGSKVDKGSDIELTCSLEGANIYYTLDETTPTNQSAVYSKPIRVESDTTIKAIAVKEGYKDSETATFTYTIKKNYTVTFDSKGGSTVAPQMVTEGNPAVEPAAPVKEYYIFDGWYIGDAIFDFQSEITGSITLTAKWIDDPANPDYGDILEEDIPKDGKIPNGLWMAGMETEGYQYTGNLIKPQIRVYFNKTKLIETKDYTVSYRNNKKAYALTADNEAYNASIAPAVIVKGKGNYSNTLTETFIINPVILSDGDSDFNYGDITLTYNGKIQKPVPKLNYQGKALKIRTDFTVAYNDALENAEAYKNQGIYYITVTGEGNYAGQLQIPMEIIQDRLLISKAKTGKISNQVYTGKEIMPELKVTMGKDSLTENTDYTVSYSNNTEVGTASVIITGINSYAGQKTLTFKITGTSLGKAKINMSTKTVIYTGDSIKLDDYEITCQNAEGEIKLEEGTDYEVSYLKNTSVGTASIVFKGKGAYTGTVKKTFKIQKYSMQDSLIQVKMDETYQYSKGGVKPEPIVTFAGDILNKGVDYTLSYSNNRAVNSGTTLKKPTVTIKGKGNFTGSILENYVIEKKDINDIPDANIIAKDKVAKNTANQYRTTLTITDLDGKVLKAGTDYDKNYTYTYAEATTVKIKNGKIFTEEVREADTPLEITDIIPANTVINLSTEGKGNYTGKLTVQYRITAGSMQSAKAAISAKVYSGEPITLSYDDIVLKVGKNELVGGTDYEIIGYSNNINKGTAYVIIKGIGNYGETKKFGFKINTKTLIK